MREIILYKAIVIDDNDEKKLGRVKIKVLPEMNGVKDENLPWALPFINLGMSKDTFSFLPPEKDTHIWVFFLDKYYQKPYYITGRFIEGLFDYDNKIKSNLDNISEIGNVNYPNPRAYLLSDNSILFYNTETKAKGIYNQNGSYILFDGDGNLYIYFKDVEAKFYNDNGRIYIDKDGNIEIYSNNQEIKIDNGNSKIDMSNNGEIKLSNNSGNIDLSNSGQVSINGHLTIDP